jgi:hypothetical protein
MAGGGGKNKESKVPALKNHITLHIVRPCGDKSPYSAYLSAKWLNAAHSCSFIVRMKYVGNKYPQHTKFLPQ